MRIAARILALVVLAVTLALVSLSARAQQSANVAGDYTGEIGPQDATLHLMLNPDGTLRGTIDHLDGGEPWMFICADVRLVGHALSFTIPSLSARWSGEFSADGSSLSGTWTQKGNSIFVSLTRVKFVPALRPSRVDGIWLGLLSIADNNSSRIQIVVKSDSKGHEFCTMDALDIFMSDLQCVKVNFKGNDLSFDIPATGSHWSGRLSEDGNSLSGVATSKMMDGGSTKILESVLNFTRQTALTPEKARPATTYDAAIPPVTAENLEAVLDQDLAEAMKSGELAPVTGEGVSIAVYAHGVRRVFSYGSAKPDSIFEIGSITKTFTGLVLAQMAEQRMATLDEPVRELLPKGAVAQPSGPEITLLDLATQRSGLPPMPDNISVANMDDPFADYHTAELLEYLNKRGVANPTHASSQFGSLGFGLLGVALADRAGLSYAALLKKEVTEPLHLTDTDVALNPEQQARFLPGHDQFHGPAKPWNSDALAGAIALRSTAGDMLSFLEANLHPERMKLDAGSAEAVTLPVALRKSLQPEAESPTGMQVALGWFYQTETGNYWHNGATAAYSSYAFFNPKGDYAAVVLLNASPGVNGSFVEVLGRHISQRLAGKPAISLAPKL